MRTVESVETAAGESGRLEAPSERALRALRSTRALGRVGPLAAVELEPPFCAHCTLMPLGWPGVCGARTLDCEYGLGVTYANGSCSYRINQLITRERSGRDHVSAELGRDI